MKLLVMLFCASLFMIGQVYASPIINIVPSPPETEKIFPPAAVFVDINIFGLQSGGLDSLLGAFDLNVRFNSTIFDYISVGWGDGLGDVGLGDVIASDTLIAVSNVIAEVNLKEVSLLSADQLSALQSDTFKLATLGFYAHNAVSQNTETLLSVPASQIILGDANGDQIAYLGSSPNTTIRLRVVPEPASLYLLSIGLLGFLISMKRCRSRRA